VDAADASLFEPAALGFAMGCWVLHVSGATATKFGTLLVCSAAKTCQQKGALWFAVAVALDFDGN
jgi:hypothetical protein